MNIKNAIVLVDQIGIEEEKGTPRLEAIIEATKSRIVPVAMASGTTILGMLPLLFDAMFGRNGRLYHGRIIGGQSVDYFCFTCYL